MNQNKNYNKDLCIITQINNVLYDKSYWCFKNNKFISNNSDTSNSPEDSNISSKYNENLIKVDNNDDTLKINYQNILVNLNNLSI